jgi:phosphoglycerol transferase MdoB-like AlkP superfamily enzyme
VNNGFNLYISVFENLQNFNNDPYVFMKDEEAARIVKNLYLVRSDTTIGILKNTRPNVVLIILESWSADLVNELGGARGITPEFSKLAGEGLLFDSIYASGARSEQGMASVFGGFPAHPISSITVQPDKFVKLPSLVKEFKKQGYSSSFYFGGQLIYGNIKGYIFFNGFDQIMEGKDFPSSIPRGKLGIHDEYTLSYMVNDLKNFKQPFFASLFTVSTHSPWDQPYPKPLTWGDNEREYINAALYTDHSLGEFISNAKKQPWYPNTLFIFVADHSHNSYRNWHPQTREYHKIPLLIYGEVLKEEFRGKRWHMLGNQHDIAATLLAQVKLKSDSFHYSKNLLNPHSRKFAYYSTDDGVGWIRPYAYFTYDKGMNIYYDWTDPKTPDSVRQEGKAYLQVVFGEYMRD